MIRKLTCILIALVSVCAAQTPLSLEDAVRRTQSQRPELRAAALRTDAAAQLRRQSAFIPNPRFFFQSENIRSSNFDFGRDADTFAGLPFSISV
jgi:hypothetical protein